ncbi:MAG: DUF6542 domain-containing protein [Nocardioidaceae bacterium]
MATASSRVTPADESTLGEDELGLSARGRGATAYEPQPHEQLSGSTAAQSGGSSVASADAVDDTDPAYDDHELWSQADEVDPSIAGATRVSSSYAVATGVPGRGTIVLALLAAALIALADVALTSALTFFFDLWFVVICLVASMAVSRRDLFTAGVLPPLLLGAVMAVIAVAQPEALAGTGAVSQAFFGGLAAHAGALVAGYAIALVVTAARMSAPRLR